LRQRGAKVTGEGRYRATKLNIEGTVRGDVFSFSESGGRVRGEMSVTGDGMSGLIWVNLTGQAGREFPLKLSRQTESQSR
jgi:hypothetical protein